MKKTFQQNIFKSVLLLLSVALLVVGTIIVAVATTSTSLYHTLTINFDDQVDKCEIEYVKDNKGTIEKKEVTNGETFEILDGVRVSIVITPKPGMWPSFTFGDTTHAAGISGRKIEWSEFIADNTVSVTCKNRTYTIHALDLDGITDVKDKLPGGDDIVYKYTVQEGEILTLEALTNGGVKYTSGSEDLIELPMVTSGTQIFKGWYIKTSEDSVSPIVPDSQTNKYYMPKTLTMMTDYMHDQDGIIYVFPKFEPKSAVVYREDWVHKETGDDHGKMQLFSSKREEFVGSSIYALALNYWVDDPLDAYKAYKGYLLHTTCNHNKCDGAPITVYDSTTEEYRNTVYRYYTPILYNLTYVDVSEQFESSQTYSYSTPTTINNPVRTGYTFKGWEIKVYNATTGEWDSYMWTIPEDQPEKCFVFGAEVSYFDEQTGTWNDPNSVYASDAQADGTYEIKLVAQWQANEYTITYPWGNLEDLITNKAELPTSFTFDATCFIPNPYRPGYIFNGWTMTYTDNDNLADASGLTEGEGGYALNCSMYTAHVTLTAKWKAESYKVELNVDGTVFDTIEKVVYDQALPVQSVTAPTLYGYNFVGYFSAPNGQGQMYFDANGNCAVAKWGLDGENNGTIVLYAFWERKPVSITVTPIEKVPEGIKITIVDKENNKEYEGNTATLLFGTEYYVKIEMPEGFKIVEWNGVAIENYSGTTFQSAVARIESEDAIVLSAKARPDAPNVGVGEDVGNIIVESDTSIKVPFANADVAGRYEVAISRDPNDTNLNWNQVPEGDTYYLFTGLNPGTTYYVFIRLQETDNTHSGIPTVKEELTRYDAYVNSVIEQLNGMFTQNDGNVTQALIQITVNKIEELKNSETLPDDFYAQIEALIAEAEQRIVFTRFQDSKIAALDTFYQSCIKSQGFSKINEELLEALCLAAVADISSAENEAAVNEIYNIAKAAMDAVPVTYLYATDSNSSITLESLLGLQQGGGIALHSVEDIKALRRAIADAIAQGKITAGSFITIEEATDLLRVLDTVGAYQLYITNVQPTKGDEFVFTITIPEHLAGRTGLQVAYYNTATGMVELLETTTQGNTLVFRAKQVADFVILADPVINLTGVIVALSVIVLCLLIAVLLVLAARNKAKNTIQHASVALPILFAAQFVPANAELIALALGAIAIILQVVLMWLLISSGMIRISKAKKAAPVQQNAPAVAGEFEQAENASEDSAIDDALIEEGAEYGELADEDLGEYEATQEVYDEDGYTDDTDDVYEEDGAEAYGEEAEEVYDDEEFIESATDPYYSMNDEENVYEFDEEETQRVSHAEETDTETEGQADDTNALDGVFGEGDVQGGYTADEAGDSRYEDEYNNSYETGDEAFAAQTNAEDADRAKEAGQGTVDPKAYIINDEEELSDAEEMYQYDE